MDKVCLLVYLAVETRRDVREGWISRISSASMLMVSLMYAVWMKESLSYHLNGLMPGIILFMISVCGKYVGRGDAWLFLAGGFVLGIVRGMEWLMRSIILLAVWEGGYQFVWKGQRRRQIPFAPYCLGAYLWCLL